MQTGYKNLKLINIFSYDTEKYPFREKISELIENKNLENLHLNFDHFLLERSKDQSTSFHKTIYKNYDTDDRFKNLYKMFIAEYCSKLLDSTLVYQNKPTFRIHMPNNVGVGEFHKDSDYNHPKEEINFLIPVTDAIETSTIWVESEPNLADYKPINLKYGNLLIFKGSLLKHGNKINLTDFTRVSFDFRVIPREEFKPNDFQSINSNMKFDIGSYYCLDKK